MALIDDRPASSSPNGHDLAGLERQPPQDLAAEQSVLGGMLLSKDAIADVIEVLRSADFYRPAHQLIFDAILDLYGRGEPADPVMVAAELERRGEIRRIGGAPYLHTLIATVPTAANAGYYAEIVAEKAILRRLVEAGTRIVQLGYAGSEGSDVNEVVDRAQASIYEVTERRTGQDYVALEELLQPTMDEIDAIASRGGTSLGVPTGFSDLDEVTHGLHPGQMIIVAARPGIGKALALDTPLATPTGWTTMGEVEVGDELMGADGRPTTVIATTEVLHGRPCYEVEFSDGEIITADAHHLWVTTTHAGERVAADRRTPRHRWTPEDVRRVVRLVTATASEPDRLVSTTELLQEVGEVFRAVLRGRIVKQVPHQGELPRPVTRQGTTYQSPVPVYSRQALLKMLAEHLAVPFTSGHLHTHQRVVTTAEIAASLRRGTSTVKRLGHAVANCEPLRLPDQQLPLAPYGLGRCLADGTHIPATYLRASHAQRHALLAGLLDATGSVTRGGQARIQVTHEQLALDIHELVVSLGLRCSMSTRHGRARDAARTTAHILSFWPPPDVLRMLPECSAFQQRGPSRAETHVRHIVDVRPVASVPVRCVQVDAPDHLYLASRSMIPTHNSTLGLDWARSCSIRHGLTSVIFSLEMSRTEIVMRMLSAEAKIRLQDMRGGRMSDDDWTRLARRMSEISEAPLFIDDSPNLTMMEIRAKARRLKQRHDLKLIVVDYMQLMTSGKRVESRQQEVSEFSRQLKLLAKELEVPVVAISQLNRGPEQRTDKRPMLSDLRESGCLTLGTRVLRADTGAEVTFGELLRSGELPVVWSLDARMRMVPRAMSRVFPSGVKDVFRLRLASGRTVEATANHPFLTVDGWIPLGELRRGDRLAVPRRVPVPLDTTSMPAAEVVLLAHLLGQGSSGRRRPVRYASTDRSNLHAVTEAAQQLGITVVRGDHSDTGRVSLWLVPPSSPQDPVRHGPLARWLAGRGPLGRREDNGGVPARLFQVPNDQVALFLRHVWATNGSVRWSERTHSAQIRFLSPRRRLADDIAQLLLRLGIQTRITQAHGSPGRDRWQVHLDEAESQLRFLDEVGVHGLRGLAARMVGERLRGQSGNAGIDTIPREIRERLRTLLASERMTHLGSSAARGSRFCGTTIWRHSPSRSRLARVTAVLDDADLDLTATNDVLWDEIVEIQKLGAQPVFDATVPGTHNFVADGVHVHNSLEQDADMVLLIHRPDAWERDDPRAGEADLILAKHRAGPTATVTVAHQLHYSRFADLAQG